MEWNGMEGSAGKRQVIAAAPLQLEMHEHSGDMKLQPKMTQAPAGPALSIQSSARTIVPK